MKRQSWILFTILVFIWGFNWTFIKIGLSFASPLNFVAQRLLIASATLLPAIIWKRGNLPKDASTWFKLFLLSTINAVGMILTHIGTLYEVSGLSSILTYTQPLFVFCLAIPLLSETVTATKVFGVTVGFLGVATIYVGRLSYSPNVSSAVPLLILGALTWAIIIIGYKKFLSHVSPETVNIMQLLIGAFFLLMAALALEGLTFIADPFYIFSLLYVSVPGTAVGFTIWFTLVRREEATVVSASSLIVPAIAFVAGCLLLGEPIDRLSIAGFVMVLAGVFLVNRPPKSKQVKDNNTVGGKIT
ncbi:MAG: DMT family transporter [Candidatus Bathyarchaeia archaeon]